MKFAADFHVHSRFSRATAKNLDLESLHVAAQEKGLTLIGTGDATHPGWLSEIREKLLPAEEGLFRLRDDLSAACDRRVPPSCRNPVRFILVSEISNIYRKNGKTYKNHNLVFLPDFETALRFNGRLDRLGNIRSDGRPILGLDARDLLEILLESSKDGFLIPAHIWTPWFSVLGSKSGFDSIEDCFEDLCSHIFALETGLSSDPPMNRRVSSLDRYCLVSNSDAHSPAKLGREANLFQTELSYPAIKNALRSRQGAGFSGTLEFYPEEGKYHLDGHRKCQVRLWPEKSREMRDKCPVCGKNLTLGVLHRVEELADRPESRDALVKPSFSRLIPLDGLLSEILRVGPGSKQVQTHYRNLLERLGPELTILNELPLDLLKRTGVPLLSEAVGRMRRNEIHMLPGYDGEFGKVRIFTDEERQKLLGRQSLFPADPDPKPVDSSPFGARGEAGGPDIHRQSRIPWTWGNPSEPAVAVEETRLNPEQQEAVVSGQGNLLIQAGPGTGKTRTLTYRIAHLIREKGVPPERILALTFTQKASEEMAERLLRLLGRGASLPMVCTFHGFCAWFLRNRTEADGFAVVDEADRKSIVSDAVGLVEERGTEVWSEDLAERIARFKGKIPEPGSARRFYPEEGEGFPEAFAAYQRILAIQKLWDYEDLIEKSLCLLESDPDLRRQCRQRFPHMFVDEYQDVNPGQYRILRALVPEGAESASTLCVIGDPDQSIYGFRGSSPEYFLRFSADYPLARSIALWRNYRSTETILKASQQVLGSQEPGAPNLHSGIEGYGHIRVIAAETEKAEAEAVGEFIERMVGGLGFFSIDSGRVDGSEEREGLGFSSFAVLYRTGRQSETFSEVFARRGIPFQTVSKEHRFAAPGIKQALSLLKLMEGNALFADLSRVFPMAGSPAEKKALKGFKSWCYESRLSVKEGLAGARKFPIPGLDRKSQLGLSDLIRRITRLEEETAQMGVEEKLRRLLGEIPEADADDRQKEAVSHLLDLARKHGHRTSDFLTATGLKTDADFYDRNAQKVSLMTLHAAKGLEFPVVFITGCEDGYLPHLRAGDRASDAAEERRLFYVGMTRAMEMLFLTWAKKRRIFGKPEKRKRSPFLDEIEAGLLQDTDSFGGKPFRRRQRQLGLF